MVRAPPRHRQLATSIGRLLAPWPGREKRIGWGWPPSIAIRDCRAAAPFTALSPIDQDSVLIDVETGAATGSGAGFAGSSAAFFAMMRTHTLQGTFGDPYYGGNANFIGWDLLGYPGVRTVVSADDQRFGVTLTPTHQSAYDHSMFTKATARAQTTEGPSRGD